MFRKKRLAFTTLAILVTLASIFSLAGCGHEGGTTETSLITQIQSDVSTLKSDVSALKSAVSSISVPAGLSGTLKALQESVDLLASQYSALNTKVAGLPSTSVDPASVIALQADVDALGASMEGVRTTLNSLTAIMDAVNGVNSDQDVAISGLVGDLAALQSEFDNLGGGEPVDLSEIEDRLDTLETAIATTNTSIGGLTADVNALEAALTAWDNWWQTQGNVPAADVTKFRAAYLEVTPRTAGDYIIAVTMYGTGLTDTVTSPSNATVTDKYLFGGNMLVVMLEPKSPAITWKTTDVIELVYTAGWVVKYASADVVDN